MGLVVNEEMYLRKNYKKIIIKFKKEKPKYFKVTRGN